MTTQLTVRAVIGSTRPSVDSTGLVFEWDGRLLRAFRGGTARLIRRLLDEPWLPELFAAGVVRFRAADVVLEGFDLVVEVDRVPWVTYPREWPVAMLRDAGVAIASVGAALARHGLGLHDAHPWNVLFDGPRPVFIDLGSITERPEVAPDWIDELRRFVVLPLALHRAGLHGIADDIQGVERGWWMHVLTRPWLRWMPIGFRRLERNRTDAVAFHTSLGQYLARLSGRTSASRPADLPARDGGIPIGDAAAYGPKERSLDEVLGAVPAGRVLDVGTGPGWYARLAARRGHDVAAIDIEERTVGSLYAMARDEGLPIVPVRMDVLYPTGSSSLALTCSAAPERLRSATVLCLGLLHHLVERQGVTFEAFADLMDLFAGERAVVEFVPADDPAVRSWGIASQPWYTPDGLVAAMAPHFRLQRTLPSAPDARCILVFERLPDH